MDLVRIWMHGSSVLFTGNIRITKEARFELKPGEETTLLISPIQPDDGGQYVCRIMLKEEINLTHHVNVINSFDVQPVS